MKNVFSINIALILQGCMLINVMYAGVFTMEEIEKEQQRLIQGTAVAKIKKTMEDFSNIMQRSPENIDISHIDIITDEDYANSVDEFVANVQKSSTKDRSCKAFSHFSFFMFLVVEFFETSFKQTIDAIEGIILSQTAASDEKKDAERWRGVFQEAIKTLNISTEKLKNWIEKLKEAQKNICS